MLVSKFVLYNISLATSVIYNIGTINLVICICSGESGDDALHRRQLSKVEAHLGPRSTHAQSSIDLRNSGSKSFTLQHSFMNAEIIFNCHEKDSFKISVRNL